MGTCPRSHGWQKQTQDFMSQLSLLPTFPTRPLCSLGCALSRASRRHSIIVPLFLYPEPAAQVTVTGEKAEATGGRPHSGTGGYSSARMTQTVLPLPAAAPGCMSPPQAGTPGQPVHRPPAHPSVHCSRQLGLGICCLPLRHTAHSTEPDTVSAFKLFAVSGEDW